MDIDSQVKTTTPGESLRRSVSTNNTFLQLKKSIRTFTFCTTIHMIKITFKGVNKKGQVIFQAFSPEGAFDIVREGIDNYFKFDVFRGHGVGEQLKVSFL